MNLQEGQFYLCETLERGAQSDPVWRPAPTVSVFLRQKLSSTTFEGLLLIEETELVESDVSWSGSSFSSAAGRLYHPVLAERTTEVRQFERAGYNFRDYTILRRVRQRSPSPGSPEPLEDEPSLSDSVQPVDWRALFADKRIEGFRAGLYELKRAHDAMKKDRRFWKGMVHDSLAATSARRNYYHVVESISRKIRDVKPRLPLVDAVRLELLIHLHDLFVGEEVHGIPLVDSRSHASLARVYLSKYLDDPLLGLMLQFHDISLAPAVDPVLRDLTERYLVSHRVFRELVNLIRGGEI